MGPFSPPQPTRGSNVESVVCCPDLLVVLFKCEICVILPSKNRCQRKAFSNNWNGIASLIAWMRDLGIREHFIRIRVTDETVVGMALHIADKLSMSNNIVGLSVSATARNPRPRADNETRS